MDSSNARASSGVGGDGGFCLLGFLSRYYSCTRFRLMRSVSPTLSFILFVSFENLGIE